jgi:FlaG/FlaF family flagellin (archaellin)
MRTKLAAIAVLPLMTVLAVPAQADPEDASAGVNYAVFLQAIAGDGIVMNDHDAILEGQAVCKFMAPPNGGSLWDAGQQVKSTHSGWDIGAALHFADRSVQDICPNRGSF